MKEKLKTKRIAILATDGFEKSELFEPKKAIEDFGGEACVVSLKPGSIKSWSDGQWSDSVEVDYTVDDIKNQEFDGLLIPGGVMNPDALRNNAKAVAFVQSFFSSSKQKPVAAICHGPWLLAEANVIENRKLTSYSSIKTDLKNAGANWVDEKVVVDNGLVTSRFPDDLPAFIDKMVEEYREGRHSLAG